MASWDERLGMGVAEVNGDGQVCGGGGGEDDERGGGGRGGGSGLLNGILYARRR